MATAPDAIVVGGGVMGCGVGLRLAQAGVKVTVLERSIPGAEASSAAGGILGPQMESEGPGPFLDLCLRSRGLYPAFAQEVEALAGMAVGYRPCGVLQLAMTEGAAQRLDATVAWQRAVGLRAELLAGAQARELEPELSKEAVAAAHFPDDHQVDNRLLTRALQMAAARAGVTFRSGYVRGVAAEGRRAVGVDLDGEVQPAGVVIVAAGSWSGLVQGSQIDPRVLRPARGQMLQLQTRLPVLNRIIASDQGYLIPRADGRIVAGSTMELVGFEKRATAGGLQKILANAISLCPALAQAEVQEFWAGLRPYTEDHLPILGHGPLEGLYLATGHFRNGILLLPITARVIAQLVLGQPPSVDLRPFRHDRFAR
jgi:glycine oxidase